MPFSIKVGLFLIFSWFCLVKAIPVTAQNLQLSYHASAPEKVIRTANVTSGVKIVYLISGLAADERLFHNLTLPSNIKTKHIAWLEPRPGETMVSYCQRMAAQIDTTQPFSLVGISFGGMVAIEMNKFIRPKQTILISSITTAQNMPAFYLFVSKWNVHKAVPGWVYKHFYQGAYWFFNPQTREQKDLIVALMNNASKNLLSWSIDQLVTWKSQVKPQNLFVIAGDHDRVFTHKHTKPDKLVNGGTHMMVYNMPEVISRVLTEQINGPVSNIAINKLN